MTDSSLNTADALVANAGAGALHNAAAATNDKNAALRAFAARLRASRDDIVRANRLDLAAADGLSAAMRERLAVDERAIEQMAAAALAVADKPDPVGTIGELRAMPSGIRVGKMRVPLGVLLVIYESRPSVTAEVAALAVKSGNAAILRGGGEARHSNLALGAIIAAALAESRLSPGTVQVVDNPDHDLVGQLLRREDGIDLVIPRGGRALIERVTAESRIPVLKHLDGNCHLYIHSDADAAMALSLAVNSKTRRYGVCNALESLLVHQDAAARVLPAIAAAYQDHGVEIRACAQTGALIDDCVAAAESDWGAEYLAPIISVKIVASLDEAIGHINRYGSGHTDAIVTETLRAAQSFLRQVDSASVIVNAATVFADGGEFGLGAEVGISTDKLHARGPVGLDGLTTEKYIVLGDGQTRP